MSVHLKENLALRDASPAVISNDKLVGFLYELLRDHLSAGQVQALVNNQRGAPGDTDFTNGWLAEYAKYLAGKLR